MFYKCNKCQYSTLNYIPSQMKRVVKNNKRWNVCPKCGAFNNKNTKDQYLQYDPTRKHMGEFTNSEKYVLKWLLQKIE